MKLQNILRVHLFPRRHVIQFSPVRTGSTLVYNLLRECLPGKTITKAHVYSYRHFSHLRVVATTRHPIDCIASLLQIAHQVPDEKHIRNAVEGYKLNGGNDLLKVKDRPNVLLLRYEEFVNNYEPIFSGVEQLFGFTISPERREELTHKYSFENARKIAESQGTFEKWDPVTKLHGNHISKFAGRTCYHTDFFSEHHLQLLRELLKEDMVALNYQ